MNWFSPRCNWRIMTSSRPAYYILTIFTVVKYTYIIRHPRRNFYMLYLFVMHKWCQSFYWVAFEISHFAHWFHDFFFFRLKDWFCCYDLANTLAPCVTRILESNFMWFKMKICIKKFLGSLFWTQNRLISTC